MDEQDLSARLQALRKDFDHSFAQARVSVRGGGEHVLAIRVGRDPYALRLTQVAVFGADRPITPVPSNCPELLGVAGLRGAMVSVYDLAALLGQERADAPRWIASYAGSALAFAFNALDGQAQVHAEDVARPVLGATAAVGDVVHVVGAARPIIDLPSLARRLEEFARAG
jgi:hypothetical protein